MQLLAGVHTVGLRNDARLLKACIALAGLISVMGAVAMALEHPVPSAAAVSARSDHAGWGAVPAAAQGPVSSGLGATERAYRVRRVASSLIAVSQAQGLRARFDSDGMAVASGGSWFGLRLTGVGFGGRSVSVGPVAPVARENRVSFARAGMSEWYANGPLGIEQGFTVARPPARQGAGGLTLSMSLSGDLHPSLVDGGRSLTLDRGDQMVLAYRRLVVSDARGHVLRSWLELHQRRLEIRVDTRGARFPLRIDPLIQQAKLTASDGAAGDQLGYSVAASSDGSTVVAGAHSATVGAYAYQGAAYVFVKGPGGWSSGTETAKLTAPDAASAAGLGWSVAVSSDGSTVVVGAPAALGSAPGAAYVFVRPGTSWSSEHETATLTASDVQPHDELGSSVGISPDGSTVVAGAPYATIAANSDQGAAYVFVKPGGGWSSGTPENETAKLTASDGATNDRLGSSVGVSSGGSTVVAGAPGANSHQGAAYVFVKPGTAWSSGTQTAKLTASDGASGDALGNSVAISSDGSTVVAGAWQATVGANYYQGAAYVFVKPGGGWSSETSETSTAKLTPSDGATNDGFGDSVGVSSDGSTAVVGADPNSERGGVYVFVKPAAGWSSEPETGKLINSDGAADSLGLSVAVSSDGSTVVAGAPGATVGVNSHQGAAYVFLKGKAGWALPAVSVSAPASATAWSAIPASAISATLSGGASPTGTVTFKVFGPQSTAPADCSGGTTVGTAHMTTDGSYSPSSGFTPTQAGDYWWYASYGGDVNNNPDGSSCGSGMPETSVTLPSPVVSQFQQTHTVWREGSAPARISGQRSGASTQGQRASRPPVGTTFTFGLNVPATVTLRFMARQPGREVNGRCVAPTTHNTHDRACTRAVPAGTLSMRAHAGHVRLAFDGRISPSRTLPLGSYTVTITATNVKGTSEGQKLNFRIVG